MDSKLWFSTTSCHSAILNSRACLSIRNGRNLDWKTDFPRELIQQDDKTAREVGPGSVLKDLVAIANGEISERGYLVYGVADSGSRRMGWMVRSRGCEDAEQGIRGFFI
jgi:hypothetical protein